MTIREDHTVDNGGVALALSSIGSGPNLLFVHGLGSAQVLWDPLVRELSERYTCWTLDLRGHGASDRAPGAYALAGYGSDVAAALDHIGEPTIGVGHSLGGTSLARVASTRHPYLESAYLLDARLSPQPSGAPPSGVAELFKKQLAMLRSFQPEGRPTEDYIDVLAAAPYVAGGTNNDAMVPEQLRGRAESLSMLDPECLDVLLAGASESDDVVSDIAIPVRMVAADPSLGAVFDARQEECLQAIAPQATLSMMAGVGHQLMMIKGCDEAVRADLETWLAALVDF